MIARGEEEADPGTPPPRLSSQGERDVSLLRESRPGQLLVDVRVVVQQQEERGV